MEPRLDIVINQTVHGYSQGHSLLANSCELTSAEKRTLLIMSDLSGQGMDEQFSEYITGYPLSGRFYALAKTWYANEMSRPGSVWTHTLLIDNALLSRITNLSTLDFLFCKPESFDLYKFNTAITQQDIKSALENKRITAYERPELFFRLSHYLYNFPEKAILVPAISSKNFEKLIYQVWNEQWPRLRRNFTFCTGSLSIRSIENQPFDLQIIPDDKKQSLVRKDSDNILIANLGTKESSDLEWIQQYKHTSLKDLLAFLYKYGSDVDGSRSKFIPLFFAYQLFEREKFTISSYEDIFDFTQLYFPQPKEAKRFKKDLFERAVSRDDSSLYNFVYKTLSLQENGSFSEVDLDLTNVIQELWQSRKISLEDVKELLKEIENKSLLNQFVNLISQLPVESWINLPLNKIDRINEVFENVDSKDYPILWKSALNNQQLFFDFLINNNLNWKIIIESMLIADNDYFASKIVNSISEEALDIALSWKKNNSKSLPPRWEFELKNNVVFFFTWLSKQTDNLNEFGSIVSKLFSPSQKQLKDIDPKIWVNFSNYLINHDKDSETVKFLIFIETASFLNNTKCAEQVISIVFQPLYDRAKSSLFDYKSWEVFLNYKDVLLNNSYENSFSQYWKNSVPNWDKCELLTRALVNSFIKHNWDEIYFIDAIRNYETFEKALEYSSTSKTKRKFIEKVLDRIKLSNV